MNKHKVKLVVYREGKILVLKSKKKFHTYSFVGGKIDEGETRKQALVREAMEEVGLELDKKKLSLIFTYCGYDNDNKNCVYFYTSEQKNLEFKLRETDKFDDADWVSLETALPFMRSRTQNIALQILYNGTH